jgi:hypothetical protein
MCSSIRYAGRAIASSPSILAILAFATLELCRDDLVGVVLTPVAIIALAIDLSTCAIVRTCLDAAAARRGEDRIAAARLQRAALAGPARHAKLLELMEIVGGLTAGDRQVAEYLELDGLLEQFSRRCVEEWASERALRAIERNGPPQTDGSAAALRRRYLRDERGRADVVRDELDAIGEAVYLFAATITCSEPDVSAQRDIERALLDGCLATSSGDGSAERSHPPPSASTSATADVIC